MVQVKVVTYNIMNKNEYLFVLIILNSLFAETKGLTGIKPEPKDQAYYKMYTEYVNITTNNSKLQEFGFTENKEISISEAACGKLMQRLSSILFLCYSEKNMNSANRLFNPTAL